MGRRWVPSPPGKDARQATRPRWLAGLPARRRLTVAGLGALLVLSACGSEPRSPEPVTPWVTPATELPTPTGERHLAVDGDDAGDGTSDQPWRTWTHALERVQPGEVLIVHGGEYTERVRNPAIVPATAQRPVTVRAAAGEQPLLRGLLWLRDPDYWTLDGLRVTWDPVTGADDEHMVKITGGRGWVIRNSEIFGAHSYAGLLVAEGTQGEPADWAVLDSCVHDTAATNDVNQDHLIYVNSGLASGPGLIAGNLLFGAPNGEGIKLGGPDPGVGGAARVQVAYNTIQGAAQSILVAWEARDNLIEGNLLTDVVGEYGVLRGFELDGASNSARGNAAAGAARFILNDRGYTGIRDGGGNVFPLDPAFDDTTSCAGFAPTSPDARAFGHLAWPAARDAAVPETVR